MGLQDAHLRVARARELLDELENMSELQGLAMLVPPYTTGTFEDTTHSFVTGNASIRVGEVLYNLSAALDYVAYEIRRVFAPQERVPLLFPAG